MAKYKIGYSTKTYPTLKAAKVAAIKSLLSDRSPRNGPPVVPIYNAETGKEVGEILGTFDSYGGSLSQNVIWSPSRSRGGHTILPNGEIYNGYVLKANGLDIASGMFFSKALEHSYSALKKGYCETTYINSVDSKGRKGPIVGTVTMSGKTVVLTMKKKYAGVPIGIYVVDANGNITRRK